MQTPGPHRFDPGDEHGWTPRKPTRGIGDLRAAVQARLPPALRSGIVDPGRRGLVALACLALVAVVVSGWLFLRARPSAAEEPSYASSPSPSAGAAVSPLPSLPVSWSGLFAPTSGASSPSAAAGLVVDVVGRVRRPGVVEVGAGSRIDDAIVAAGGALPGTDLTGLDLAAKVADGEQIFVGIAVPSGTNAAVGGGVVSGPAAGAPDGAADGAAASALVNLNTADLTELETLPGVGAVLGQRILDWRTAHGTFGSVAQLQQVSGIGPAKYAALASKVTV